MCNGKKDDADKAGLFLPETNSHPASNIPRSAFCPLNGASIGPSLATLPFSAAAAFLYVVCSISYFLLSCKIRLLHIGWKKKKVVNFCTTFKMNLQIMKKWVSPYRTHPRRKRWDSNPRALADNLISSHFSLMIFSGNYAKMEVHNGSQNSAVYCGFRLPFFAFI